MGWREPLSTLDELCGPLSVQNPPMIVFQADFLPRTLMQIVTYTLEIL